MVGGNTIDHHRVLPILRRDLDAQLDVRALVLVREDFADVVQQRAALCQMHIQLELARHDPGQPRHFLGVLVHVLTV